MVQPLKVTNSTLKTKKTTYFISFYLYGYSSQVPSVQKVFDTKQMRICIYKAKSRVMSRKLRGSQDSLSQDWTTTTAWQDAIVSCFPFSYFLSQIPKFLFGSEQINKTLKVYLKRADQECGTVCCVQHWSTKFHKEKETM